MGLPLGSTCPLYLPGSWPPNWAHSFWHQGSGDGKTPFFSITDEASPEAGDEIRTWSEKAAAAPLGIRASASEGLRAEVRPSIDTRSPRAVGRGPAPPGVS